MREFCLVAVGLSCLSAGVSDSGLPAVHAGEQQAKASVQAMPAVGGTAADFELAAVTGTLQGQVKLSEVAAKGPVVLVVLRGYPGYQCPLCTRQIGELIGKAEDFQAAGATVLLVYPGPRASLKTKAEEFVKNTDLPKPFTLLLDPGYKFTNAYRLRWKAPRETAYPSTFVLDKNRKIHFAKISKTHGGRSAAKDVVAAVQALKK